MNGADARSRRPRLVPVAPLDPDRTDIGMATPASPEASTESPARRAFVVDPVADPRDVFMTAQDVHDYLGRGRTQGYEVTSDQAFQRYQAEPGRWRLCDVRRYYDDKVAAQVCGAAEPATPAAGSVPSASATPAAKSTTRARRTEPSVTTDNPFLNSPRRSNAPGTKKGSTR